MGEFFNPEKGIWAWLSTMVDIVGLSVLWIFLCLPVVTIGPATAALYYTVVKYVRKREGGVSIQFQCDIGCHLMGYRGRIYNVRLSAVVAYRLHAISVNTLRKLVKLTVENIKAAMAGCNRRHVRLNRIRITVDTPHVEACPFQFQSIGLTRSGHTAQCRSSERFYSHFPASQKCLYHGLRNCSHMLKPNPRHYSCS